MMSISIAYFKYLVIYLRCLFYLLGVEYMI
ncbi:Uncharacterized protein OBRU01_23529, partial [Operophtera brumata]